MLNVFLRNIKWEVEFLNENIDDCYGWFCDTHGEGVRTRVSLAVNREEMLDEVVIRLDK